MSMYAPTQDEFDLDAWLDEIEPPRHIVTVNTRGDLLAEYGQLQASKATGRVDEIDVRLSVLRDQYAANRATFAFASVPDDERRLILAGRDDDPQRPRVEDEASLRLFLAATRSLTICRDGVDSVVDPKTWTPEILQRFLTRIGDGQRMRLFDEYLATASPPPVLDRGATTD